MLSHQRIADLNLIAGNFQAAEAYYMELYYLAPEEQHFRAYGIAGLANVYFRMNMVAKMADRLIELGEVLPLLNEDIQQELMERLDTELREIVEQFQADTAGSQCQRMRRRKSQFRFRICNHISLV